MTGKGEFILEATLTDAQGEVVASTVGTYQVRRLGCSSTTVDLPAHVNHS